MHELMIFFSTLGGLFMFGLAGIFIGPLIASLFISIWELYGAEFAEVLPDVDWVLDVLDEDEMQTDDDNEVESIQAEACRDSGSETA